MICFGTHRVEFSKPGFQGYDVGGIVMHPAIAATVNVRLQAGAVESSIEVQDSAAQVETSTPALSSQVSEKQVSTLPLNGRNYQSLSALMPGVTNTAPGQSVNPGGFITTNVLSVTFRLYVDGKLIASGDVTYHLFNGYPDEGY
jgi:hypothetical protein